MEKLNNWITSEDQVSVNIQDYQAIEKVNPLNDKYYIFFESNKGGRIEWSFDLEAERDTAYKNIQKLMVNIEYK